MLVEFYKRNEKYKNKPSMYHWVYTYKVDPAETITLNLRSKRKVIEECIGVCLDKGLVGFKFKMKSEVVTIYLEEKNY